MPDSKSFRDRPDRRREAVFKARNSASSSQPSKSASEPTGENLLVPSWGRFETWLEMTHRLLGLQAEEASLRRIDAAATQAAAKAEEAAQRAAAEPERQKISLLERTVELLLRVLKYGLAALLTLVVIGLEIALFAFSPGLFSLNLLVAFGVIWRQVARREKRESREDERKGDP